MLLSGYCLPQACLVCCVVLLNSFMTPYNISLELGNDSILKVERLQKVTTLNIDFENWNELEVFYS